MTSLQSVLAEVANVILLIPGSLRKASSNAAVLRTAARVAPEGIECLIYARLASLPAFNPDEDRHPLPPEVEGLRGAIHNADAIVFSTPEYAGSLPGSLKNLLDWTIGDDQAGSIYDKPVAWINASARGADQTHCQLRIVLSYAHAKLIDAACAHVPVTARSIGPDGLISDERSRVHLREALAALANAVNSR